MRRSLLLLVPLLALGIALTAPILVAQTESASLSGVVTDASGAVVPNVRITVTQRKSPPGQTAFTIWDLPARASVLSHK